MQSNSTLHNLILIIMRETEALLKLVVSILTAIILFPLTLVVGVLRIIKSILSIIEKTILAFIKNVRQELIK